MVLKTRSTFRKVSVLFVTNRILRSCNKNERSFKSFNFWDITLCLPSDFTLVSSLAYYSTLKMEATCFPETSFDLQRSTWRYIPEDRTLHKHRCENLKTYEGKF
jgi:hypothetical protein